MSANRDFDRIASAWMAEGPYELADRVLDAALDEVHLTNQRRRITVPWRTPQMNVMMRLAAGIAVVAIAGVGAMNLVNPSPGPAATASPSISPSGSPALSAGPNSKLDTSNWVAFTSERYGFNIKRHPAFMERPSLGRWEMADAHNCCAVSTEVFWRGPGGSSALTISAWSVAVSPGTSLDEWLQTWCAIPADFCPTDPSVDVRVPVTTADGHAGVSITAPMRGLTSTANVAFVLVSDRVYLVTVSAAEDHPTLIELGGLQRISEAVVSTMTLRPNGPAPEASPPALTGSFTSERYGYSVKYPDAFWTAKPATELWVPGTEQGLRQYDFLESSIGFRGASAVIPEAVNIDDWITEKAIGHGPVACAPARWSLSDIVIDGQTGKVRISCEEIEATVVADDRLYVFTLFLDEGEPWSIAGGRALFEAMIATVQLTPETAEGSPGSAP